MIESKALRMTFLVMAAVVWLGLWLTGVNVVHWVLFLPAVFLALAGISGICPGLIISKMLLREN